MPDRVIDPVCKMEISREAAFDSLEFEGTTYYFCAPSCRDRFKESPRDYVEPKRK